MFEGWERRTICHMAAAPPSLAFRDSDLQNWKQDHSLLLSLELSSPKPPSAVGRPHPDCPTWVRAHIPTAQNQTHQVNVHTGLPTVVSPTTDISCFRRSCMNQAQKVPKQHLLWKAAKVMLLSCSTWWCENSLLLKLSAHPSGTQLPPSLPPSQGVPVSSSRRRNLSKNIGAVQEDC